MSFVVVHMQKHDKSAIRGIQIHNQRELESNTNDDIDYARSELNYDLVNDNPINYTQKINERIESLNLKRAVRKDAVRLCSFIVGSDKEFFENLPIEQHEQFFKDSVSWFQNRYGKENVIFGQVHYDEATPHLHVGVVPITEGKLSAKVLFDRNELRAIQTEFHLDVGENFGLIRGLEGSDKKHLSEIEYKVQQEQLKQEKMIEQTKKMNKDLSSLQKKHKQATTVHQSAFEGDFKNPLLNKDALIVPKDDLKALQKQASRVWFATNDLKEANQKNERLQSDLNQMKKVNSDLRAENENLQELNQWWRVMDFVKSNAYEDILEEHGIEIEVSNEELELRGRTRITNYYDLDKVEEVLGEDFNQDSYDLFEESESKNVFVKGMLQAKEKIQEWYSIAKEKIHEWTMER